MSPGLLLLIPLLAFFGYGIRRIIKFGGLAGAGFGARIDATVGELPLAVGSLTSTRLSVHQLDGGSDRAVGVMVRSGMAGQLQVSLSKLQTQRLIETLEAETSGD